MEPIQYKPKTWYFCDPEKNTECRKTRCAYKPDPVEGCFATSKKDCARLDFHGEPCAVPEWALSHHRQYKLFCAIEKFYDCLYAIRKAVFHKKNTSGR